MITSDRWHKIRESGSFVVNVLGHEHVGRDRLDQHGDPVADGSGGRERHYRLQSGVGRFGVDAPPPDVSMGATGERIAPL